MARPGVPALLVGVTGGIATGKSLVTDELEALGAAVIDADRTYHRLLRDDPALDARIREAFGDDLHDQAGQLVRSRLAARVFGDRQALDRLNRITHPAVLEDIRRQIRRLEHAGSRLIFVSVPLLYESGMDAMTPRVVVVSCRPDQQEDRLMHRAGIDRPEAHRRIASQMPLGEKLQRAWREIPNDGTPEDARARVRGLYRELVDEARPPA